MRLDKFLKVSRLIKRRTVANEACDAGRVLVNGKTAKASVKVKPGDVIEIQFGTKTVKAEVLDLRDTTKKEEAAEFTFFLAIPVMFGASLLKLVKFGFAFSSTELIILIVGVVVSFVVSILAIKFLMGYIKKHDFKVFGWYRIILGILVLGYFVGKTFLA